MDPVPAYLEYLREMARKIAYRGTFLNVLHRKSKRSPDRYISWDAPRTPVDMQRYLTAVEQDTRAQDGRTLFIGVGLLAGRLVQSGSTNIVAAPFLTIPVELEPPETADQDIGYAPVWTALSINYDLLTSVIEKTDVVDPDDQIGQPDQMSPAVGKAINDLEVELDRLTKDKGAAQRILEPDFAAKCLDHLRVEIPAFRETVEDARVPFRKELLNQFVEGKTISWFNHRFAFMGTMPDSLSAYEALNDLCAKVRGSR